MQILLPPSEGKAAPESGGPVQPAQLFRPGLAEARQQVTEALIALCRGDADRAAAVLKLGERQRGDLAGNAAILTAATAPAESVYTGVLFEALNLAELPPAARDRAHRQLVIFSGLWGVVRPVDAIPTYRCPIGVTMPNLSGDRPMGLGSFWRKRLSAELPAAFGEEFILDLRSGAYQAMWSPHAGYATVRVLHERTVAGRVVRSVVSHFNKATKGRLAAELLAQAPDCGDASQLLEAVRDLKYTAETSPTDPRRIDIVVTEL